MAIFRNSYFWKDGQLYFDHLHGDQYASFLYRLGHVAGKAGPEFQGLAVKTYLLNKALHGLDAFYQVALPESCWLAHPVGTVIGRATFGGPLVVMQGCTIGNRASKYPTFGKRVIICAQSTVIGECHVGDDVCIGAGCLLVNTSVPSGSTVVGRGQDLRIMTQRSSIFESVFLS
jgi:serine O-acetyltransferase